MENDLVKRLMWTGLMAGITALCSLIASRIAGALWLRIFNEDPPE